VSSNGERATTFLSALGQENLTGLRGRMARPVAGAVSRRTRFTPEQVSAVIGLALLALSIYGLVSTVRRAARAGARTA
jgi:hypothetical protein